MDLMFHRLVFTYCACEMYAPSFIGCMSLQVKAKVAEASKSSDNVTDPSNDDSGKVICTLSMSRSRPSACLYLLSPYCHCKIFNSCSTLLY